MGYVLSILGWTGIVAWEALKLVYFFLIIIPLSGGIVLIARDDLHSHVNPYVPSIAVKCDRPEYQGQLKDQTIDIQWWNRRTGEAFVCWRDHPMQCGTMQQLWLYCWDWSASGVPDDIPKQAFSGMEAYTPNGTVHIKTPNGDGPVNATWVAPLAGDCKYWDKDWKWPAHEQKWEHTSVMNLTKSFYEEQWSPPIRKIPNLGPHQPGSTVSRRDTRPLNEQIEDHFSKLPRRDTASAVETFATDGAALLHRSIQSRAVRSDDRENSDTHQTLHRAFASILEAHASEAGRTSLWKRMFSRITREPAFVPADTVLNTLSDALIAASHDDDKRRMETFAISGVFQAITDRVKAGATVGEAEFRALARLWEKVFDEDYSARR